MERIRNVGWQKHPISALLSYPQARGAPRMPWQRDSAMSASRNALTTSPFPTNVASYDRSFGIVIAVARNATTVFLGGAFMKLFSNLTISPLLEGPCPSGWGKTSERDAIQIWPREMRASYGPTPRPHSPSIPNGATYYVYSTRRLYLRN